MKNRFMLAPLTNMQSHADGTISDDEFNCLVKRAEGGFGLVMTCAAHVQARGQGFAGQLGCFSDDHLPGLTRLADAIRSHGALSIVQLHHAGVRAPIELTGVEPIAPYDDESTSARAMTTAEVEQAIEDFVAAAVRAERAGFDGVELHNAHNYLLCEFLEAERNQRTDGYGGSLENRSRVLFTIIQEIRQRCRPDFNLSVRFSAERFGMVTSDVMEVYERVAASGDVDFIDMSMWDVFKAPHDEGLGATSLLELFSQLERGSCRLGVAGKIYSAADVRRVLDSGVEIVVLGRAAITNHDFPLQMEKDAEFAMRELPVTAEQLHAEGLGEGFVQYMRGWQGFVAD